jgi:hypothetical protein
MALRNPRIKEWGSWEEFRILRLSESEIRDEH